MNKQFKDLTFTDDFMFCHVMQNNEDIARGVVESILGFEIGGIVRNENQKAIKITKNGRGVRFDIFLKGEDGKVYDIEMQTTSERDLAKRSRYYQSMLDRYLLNEGQDYRELNDSYIIFIMLQDIFHLGYNVYKFRSFCEDQLDLALEDGATRVFVNASKIGKNSSKELRNLISYIQNGETKDSLTKRIAECVKDAKLDPRAEGDFMTLWEMKEESFNEGIAIGEAKGLAEAALRAIPAMIERGMSLEEACEIQGITPDEYQALLDSHAN